MTTLPDYPHALVPDTWLAAALGRPSFRLEPRDDAPANANPPPGRAFAYAKLAAGEIERLNLLLAGGWRLAEVAVELARGRAPEPAPPDGIRFADDADRGAIGDIAAVAFTQNRFHLDPEIGPEGCGRVKRAWTDAFFSGGRGSHMIVADEAGAAAGFLQAILKDGRLTIDLIAVDSAHQGRGVGRRLVAFALGAIPGWREARVQTQLHNAASIALYQAQGFALARAGYTLHAHWR